MTRIASYEADVASDSGFSLLEVLIALTVIAVMSALMVQGISQLRHLVRAEHEIEAQLALEKTVRHIARLIAQSERIPLLPNTRPAAKYMSGDTSEVKFVAVARLGARSGSLAQIELFSEQSHETRKVIQQMTLRRSAPTPGAVERVELISELDTLSFSYLAAQPEEDELAAWQDAWNSPGELPAAVKVTLRTDVAGKTLSAVSLAIVEQSRPGH